MNSEINEIAINGKTYVEKGSSMPQATGEYSIVRTYSAGVFFGVLSSRDGKEGVVKDAIRLWRWAGAASLSELALVGPKKPKECKFPPAVSSVTLTEIIEIIPCTEMAAKAIMGVPSWTA